LDARFNRLDGDPAHAALEIRIQLTGSDELKDFRLAQPPKRLASVVPTTSGRTLMLGLAGFSAALLLCCLFIRTLAWLRWSVMGCVGRFS